jgi:hypothetical protein
MHAVCIVLGYSLCTTAVCECGVKLVHKFRYYSCNTDRGVSKKSLILVWLNFFIMNQGMTDCTVIEQK